MTASLLHDYLIKNSTTFSFATYDKEVASAQAAAAQIGLEPEQMIKSLVVKQDEVFTLFLIPLPLKLDLEKVRQLTNCRVAQLASPQEVKENTGYSVGVVSPFLLEKQFSLYIDQTVLNQQKVGVGSGQKGREILIDSKELARLAHATVVSVVK